MASLHKTCKDCKESKPITEFYKDKNAPDKLRYSCKTCWNKSSDKKRTRMQKYYSKNSDKYEKNRKNRATKIIRSGEKKCPSCKKLLSISHFYHNKKDRISHNCKDCRRAKRNLDVAKVSMHKRMERQKELPNTLTIQEWEYIKAMFGYKCAYCGETTNKLTLDHFIPVSHKGGTTKKNTVPACKSCNSRKGSKMPQDFLGRREYVRISSLLRRV